ncbi:hypothetical protein HNQ93_002516 [Hymenobacter luteus]|uniref:DUF2911 domain-containing protein n=2 Tax=Hymenobacter TaxID=89966 RepID=A0A7W9T129_9BACT|nr:MULTISPECIES: DUF2911 domain-containing protein [Hymenobacter]MBB4601915.1 hypothetical protein [Hymenobacter latericoloratus]MBB6059656.1 hypothetical protein [Hymenobacter luteus]
MPHVYPPARLCFLLTLLLLVVVAACTREKNPDEKPARPSPPAVVTGGRGAATFTIRYSQPSAKGRKIFGGLVPYGQVWRTGANEATTFSVNQNVTVQGRPLPAGTYALFTIPGAQQWTVIFNRTPNQWGAYEYQEADDVLRVKATPAATPQTLEQFLITADQAGRVTLAWENTQVSFVVK